jgi:hypothetical protein
MLDEKLRQVINKLNFETIFIKDNNNNNDNNNNDKYRYLYSRFGIICRGIE